MNPVTESERGVDRFLEDSVRELGGDESDVTPPIVQISDIHGYLESARNALLTVGDVDQFDPIVEMDPHGELHWSGDREYVLVVNGDVIDRGPASAECLDLVRRLQREAPAGNVRYHLGNHEMALLLPDVLGWSHWYAGKQPDSVRREFYEAILEGRVAVAFEGYDHTYTHAGSPDPIDAATLNESLRTAARELLESTDGTDFADVQQAVVDKFPSIFGIGDPNGAVPVPASSGSTTATCQRTRRNRSSDIRAAKADSRGERRLRKRYQEERESIGGERVVVEAPDRIGVVVRKEDRSASCTFFPT